MTDTTTTQATVATLGAGTSTHLAYYLASGLLRGTYCDRAASDTKRVRPHHGMRAEQVTCKRCLKVAAAETSVPAQEAERRARQEAQAQEPSTYCSSFPTADHSGCPSSVECHHASYSFTHHADGTARGNHPQPSAYLVHAWSTCHAMAPEDLVADPSTLLPTCGDCLEQVAL